MTTVYGYVLDRESGEPGPGIQVTATLLPASVHLATVPGARDLTYTDENGRFELVLTPNVAVAGSYYRIRSWLIGSQYIVVPDSDTAIDLETILVDPGALDPVASSGSPLVYLARVERGASGGVASLDLEGKVPLGQLPAGIGGGNTVLNGAAMPNSGLGADGDFYINTTAETIYGPKTAGAWGSPTSLIGPQGATGSAGATGATGASGSTGAVGPDGKSVRNGSGAPSSGLGADGDFYINIAAHTLYGPKTAGVWGSPTALVGPTGAQGPEGPQGAQGNTGPGLQLAGTVATYAALPTGLDAGDTGIGYLVSADGQLYVWDGDSFPTNGAGLAFQGPAGDTGPQGSTGSTGSTGATGATGAAGADGKTVRNGTGAPSGGLGVDGDFYIDTTAHAVYGPKTSGAWGSGVSLIGPTGAQGAPGSDADVTAHEAASDPHPQYMTSAEVTTAISGKADDSAVVHTTTDETVAGIKTFSSAPVVPVGAVSGNPVRRDDSRLTDSRTPTAHKTSHATGGGDALVASDIGAAATSHTHAASDVNSGTLAIGRVPTGTSSSTVSLGDHNHSGVYAAATHNHAGSDINSGTVAAARLPLVRDTPYTLTYAATLAVDATNGNFQRSALTGNITAWSLSNGVDGQKLLVWLTASSGSRTVDLSGLTALSFIPDSFTVTSTTPGAVGFVCNGTNTWTCIAAGVVG